MSHRRQESATVKKVAGHGQSHHSYSEEEKAAFAEHISQTLSNDADVGHHTPYLPIDPASHELFTTIKDGWVLCKLINLAVKDTVDVRALNRPKPGQTLNPWQMQENMNLVVNACLAIGCKMVNVGGEDLIKGREILVLGVIWQIVKIQLTADITLEHCPFLMQLLNEGEELSDLMAMSPEQILLRWFNYHLAAAGSEKRVANFSGDVKDGEAYSTLLHQLAPDTCDLCTESDASARAAHIIANAKKLGVPCFVKPGDITTGNAKLNLAFVAQIFNTRPGLEASEEEISAMADMFDDDDENDSREERIFRMWLNSLGMDGVYVNNLFSDLSDGIVLLKAEDKVEPGSVTWKRVNLKLPLKSKFKKVENCNYAVVVGKGMKFSLVGIGGVDIHDGNKKLILSVIWQLMRHHTIKILTMISGTGEKIEDKSIIAWANERVADGGFTTKMRSFRDKSLASGVFLLELLTAMRPQTVNPDMITAGVETEERVQNAKYAISVARKLGAAVFLTFDDIIEVKPKMMLTFIGCLMAADGATGARSRKLSQVDMGGGRSLSVAVAAVEAGRKASIVAGGAAAVAAASVPEEAPVAVSVAAPPAEEEKVDAGVAAAELLAKAEAEVVEAKAKAEADAAKLAAAEEAEEKAKAENAAAAQAAAAAAKVAELEAAAEAVADAGADESKAAPAAPSAEEVAAAADAEAKIQAAREAGEAADAARAEAAAAEAKAAADAAAAAEGVPVGETGGEAGAAARAEQAAAPVTQEVAQAAAPAKQELTDGVFLLTTTDGDQGFTYHVENTWDGSTGHTGIIFKMDFADSVNLVLESGGLTAATEVPNGEKKLAGTIKRVDPKKGYELKLSMGLESTQ